MGKAPPPKDFVFSDDDDDDQVVGGGDPDDDGMVYLKGKHGLAGKRNTGKRKADSEKARVVRRAIKRPPSSNP